MSLGLNSAGHGHEVRLVLCKVEVIFRTLLGSHKKLRSTFVNYRAHSRLTIALSPWAGEWCCHRRGKGSWQASLVRRVGYLRPSAFQLKGVSFMSSFCHLVPKEDE